MMQLKYLQKFEYYLKLYFNIIIEMNFCPSCDFMVYTKKLKDENKLINYCKNCEWSGEYQSSGGGSICVYSKNYSNDFLAQQAITSKYTVNDPTLPRISNIDCINENCLTNLV